MKLIDLTGMTFGRLLVLGRAPVAGPVRWNCRCECGRSAVVKGALLRRGHTRSCGCLQRENARTHGQTYSPTYRSWSAMVQRCTNPNHPDFAHYGGRGISVCKEWLRSFDVFLGEMGQRPKGLSLDRIDNDGNYEPGNCRWATQKEQCNNRRQRCNAKLLTHAGRTQTLAEWARELGIPYNTVAARVGKYGWSAEKALTTPVVRGGLKCG